jgi:hypothetical protein
MNSISMKALKIPNDLPMPFFGFGFHRRDLCAGKAFIQFLFINDFLRVVPVIRIAKTGNPCPDAGLTLVTGASLPTR